MSRFQSHINTAEKIISKYDGSIPFHHFLKSFFAEEKKYGSKDRKSIARNCYAYFRVALACQHMNIQETIRKGMYLTGQEPAEGMDEELIGTMAFPDLQKLAIAGIQPMDLFPFHSALSAAVDRDAFVLSLLHQPDLFLRIRPGKTTRVLEKLAASGRPYNQVSGDGLALKQSVPVNELFETDKEVVIQDLSSQQVFDSFMDLLPVPSGSRLAVWDCCAGSGGKSILFRDKYMGDAVITATDSRKNILYNYKNRMKSAGIPIKSCTVADLGSKAPFDERFDLIICDVPCSGSGTWSRSPEQLFYHSPESLDSFTRRQEQIIKNVLPCLAPGGILLYITCSVFAGENENMVHSAAALHSLQILRESYVRGYDRRADTMYAAALRKNVRA